MKPSPLSILDIPADWPTTGTLPNGSAIELREAWQTGTFAMLASITVNVPGQGSIQPWSNSLDLHFFEIPEGTDGLLPREELEANGVVDATLEAWARDDHKITIDLSGQDTPDLQYLRADAWKRFAAEGW